MSNKRDQLRQQRQAAEAAAAARSRRRKVLLLFIVAILAGGLLALGLLIISEQNSRPSAPNSTAAENNKLLAGIEQQELLLGDPQAPIKIVEFADLRCPYCAVLSAGGIKELIAGPVANGQVQLEFRHLSGSEDVARGMYAAAEQGRGWQFIKNFFGQQGQESGAVQFAEIKEIAEQSGVPDIAKWEKDYQRPEWDQRLLEVEDQAADLGISGTPAIAIEKEGRLRVTDLDFQSTGADFQRLINQQK
jgi:protein-disulfide isomerase